MTEIIKEQFIQRDERGEWTGVKLIIDKDFYIDVACKGDGSERRANQIAEELHGALVQVMQAQYEQSRKSPNAPITHIEDEPTNKE